MIKIMRGDYAIDVTVGSSLSKKVCATLSDYFNRRMHSLLDNVKPFEARYKLKDPKLLKGDPLYSSLGPFALCGKLQEEHDGKLLAEKDWPALASTLPSGKHTSAHPKGETHTCFNCKAVGHISPNFPQARTHGGCGGRGSGRSACDGGRGRGNRTRGPEAAWKYLHPQDENQTIDIEGELWKFCQECFCSATQKKGFYNLSHSTSGHATHDGATAPPTEDQLMPYVAPAANISDVVNPPVAPALLDLILPPEP
jgi:hypothetical protein